MARTAFYAPAHRINNKQPPGQAGLPPDLAPSLDFDGSGIQDSRWPYNQYGANGGVCGWYSEGPLIDAVPSTLTTTALAAAQAATAGTALTLVSATGAGITVLAAATRLFPTLSVAPVGSLAIDGLPGQVTFGSEFVTAFYDPTKALARNIQIASAGNDSGGYFTVSGFDFYGYPMTERITGANVGTAAGRKAFKIVTSIVPGGTISGSNVSAGQGDTYGLPIACNGTNYVTGVWNALNIVGTGTVTAADTTSPATSTTGDVRGTYLVASASNATKRLTVFVAPSINLLAAQGVIAGMWGQTPA
jgi:hypothetical protein